MRMVVKKRILFLVIAITLYTVGFKTIPAELNYDSSLASIDKLLFSVINYFLIIPTLYWFLIIKAGSQKTWKLLIIISISATCARFSFPSQIAEYFEFIMWIRYPIIAILLLIELYIIKAVIVGLWQARKLKGDPRIHAFYKFKDDDKKLMAALLVAWEPASWYYAIPRFSRQHSSSIGTLSLYSSKGLHYASLVLSCLLLSSMSYWWLIDWSEIAAILVSSLVLWTLVAITANYRVAKLYSIYKMDDKLIINNSFLNFMAVSLNEIISVEVADVRFKKENEELCFGSGGDFNVILKFSKQQTYIGGMGSFPEKMNQVKMNVKNAQQFADNINLHIK